MSDKPQPSAGWYPDPSGSPNQRRWDGQAWTEETRAFPAPSAPAPQPIWPPAPGSPPDAAAAEAAAQKAEIQKKTNRGCLTVLAIVVALVVFGSICGSDDEGGGSSDSGDEKEFAAFGICKDFVKDRLKSPSTATFRGFFDQDGEVTVSGVGNGPYVVSSTVDSENSFGGKIRSSFVCTVTNTSGDKWRLDDMQFVDGGG